MRIPPIFGIEKYVFGGLVSKSLTLRLQFDDLLILFNYKFLENFQEGEVL